MQDERKSVCVLFREVQHIFPPVMRNEPDLQKMLVTSAHFRTPEGDDIELYQTATQELAVADYFGEFQAGSNAGTGNGDPAKGSRKWSLR
jgi:hypothetical protein